MMQFFFLFLLLISLLLSFFCFCNLVFLLLHFGSTDFREGSALIVNHAHPVNGGAADRILERTEFSSRETVL